MYRYDLHVHTNVGSLCAVSTPEEMVDAYYKAGYSGFCITDHFVCGNTAVSSDLPWEERIKLYYSAFERAKKHSEKYPEFNVFFGGEYAYAGGHELLLYGMKTEFLLTHKNVFTLPVKKFCKAMQESGCIVIKAHPYRVREYNDPAISPELYCVDGVETYNSHNTPQENRKAKLFAEKNHMIMTSGGDTHSCNDKNIGLAGIITEKPLNSIDDLTFVLKNGEYRFV